jgi:hypothetical protein
MSMLPVRWMNDQGQCTGEALQLGEKEPLDEGGEEDDNDDDDDNDEEGRSSGRKGKGKGKAKTTEPKPKPKKKAAPGARGKEKAKEVGQHVAAEATGEAGNSAPGVEAGPSNRTPSQEPTPEPSSSLPRTLAGIEAILPQFVAAQYGIIDEMDPDFDEELEQLNMSAQPDYVRYFTLELDRVTTQYGALRAANLDYALDALAYDELNARAKAIQILVPKYTGRPIEEDITFLQDPEVPLVSVSVPQIDDGDGDVDMAGE